MQPVLEEAAKAYPVVTLVGPRQSGKTTLARAIFPEHRYVSLEDPELRTLATNDPRGLFERFSGSLILDEVQRAPELTSYIQTRVDDPSDHAHFVLTGSHNLLLMEAVSQSLAGRTRVLELLPFSLAELLAHDGELQSLNEVLWTGGYPAIHDRGHDPTTWHRDYFRLYVERDVRAIVQIRNLDRFETFVRLCAGRIGQLANFAALAGEVGVSQPTAREWYGALTTTFVSFSLRPHFTNFGKRLVKSPKIYFYDTGLLCYLLGIREPSMLDTHPLRGSIFENLVVAELTKRAHNAGEESRLYFWRDHAGHEVDLVRDDGAALYPIELKAAATFHPDFVAALRYFNRLQGLTDAEAAGAVYCAIAGPDYDYRGYGVKSWRSLAR